jgi:hypothetical protein
VSAADPRRRWLCWLIGHRWQWDRHERHVRGYCLRCGALVLYRES